MVVAQDMLLSFARKSSLYALVTQPFNINISFPYSIGIDMVFLPYRLQLFPPSLLLSSHIFGQF